MGENMYNKLNATITTSASNETSTSNRKEIKMIPLELINDPENPMRFDMNKNALNELAESIRMSGLLQPIVVYRQNQRYTVVAGHRRLIAHRINKATEILAMVCDIDNDTVLSMRYAENAYREDISLFDEAVFLSKLKDDRKITLVALANLVGKSKTYVAERCEVMNYDHVLLKAVADNAISFSIARIFNRCNDTNELRGMVKQAINGGVSINTARDWVRMSNLDSDMTDQAQEQETEPQPPLTQSPSQLMTICSICTKPTPNNDIKTVYLCGGCATAINV